MLVLQRGVNESFQLDRDGELLGKVTVYRSKDGKLRLGIEAPPTVRVLRTELIGREPRKLLATDQTPIEQLR